MACGLLTTEHSHAKRETMACGEGAGHTAGDQTFAVIPAKAGIQWRRFGMAMGGGAINARDSGFPPARERRRIGSLNAPC